MINKIFTNNEHYVAMMNIINEARLNPPKEGHKHHIIPRCWFKLNNLDIDNSDNNLVLLSYDDHVKVHKLMYHCTTGITKRNMAYAYKRISKGKIVENGCFKGENNPNFGKKHSAETRRKISELNKGRLKGENHPLFGKTHSAESRRKMSAAKKGNSWNKGRTSPNKGMSWKLVNGKRIYSDNKK